MADLIDDEERRAIAAFLERSEITKVAQGASAFAAEIRWCRYRRRLIYIDNPDPKLKPCNRIRGAVEPRKEKYKPIPPVRHGPWPATVRLKEKLAAIVGDDALGCSSWHDVAKHVDDIAPSTLRRHLGRFGLYEKLKERRAAQLRRRRACVAAHFRQGRRAAEIGRLLGYDRHVIQQDIRRIAGAAAAS